MDKIEVDLLPELSTSQNTPEKLEHHKAHWASCSVDLPVLPHTAAINAICKNLPKSILRVKGCTQIKGEKQYTYFERKPDGEIHSRPFNGKPITGAKLLTIGPGSEPYILEKTIKSVLKEYKNIRL